MAENKDDPFLDLEGEFQETAVQDDTLGRDDRIPVANGAQSPRKNYWKISFQRVQYGTYDHEPACLIVVDGMFHSEDRNLYKLIWAKITIDFQNNGESVEIKGIAPEKAYGITIPELHSSNWSIRMKDTFAIPSALATIDIWDPRHDSKRSFRTDRVASMSGSKTGFPRATQAVWKVEEVNQEGIPLRIPSLVVLLRHTENAKLTAKFTVRAEVGFSTNPARLPILEAPLKQVEFDGKRQLIRQGEQVDNDFSNLDLSSLTTLNFSGDQ